ncbi:hypothetical protein IAE29_21935 [Ochrobactrum sp. S46]|nr:hypothetical protein [Ochrobactrum sp. S45]MBK0045997.1 hypothetical protein [Ochrobactrum sp. S46]
MTMDEVVRATETAMDEILSCFKPDSKITVLVRSPRKPNSDFCLTNDELPEVAEMIKRRRMEASHANA